MSGTEHRPPYSSVCDSPFRIVVVFPVLLVRSPLNAMSKLMCQYERFRFRRQIAIDSDQQDRLAFALCNRSVSPMTKRDSPNAHRIERVESLAERAHEFREVKTRTVLGLV